MPEQRKPSLLLDKPPQLPYEELPPSWLHKLLGGVIDAQGRPKASPKGSGTGVKHDAPANVQWPREADLEALKARLRKPDGK